MSQLDLSGRIYLQQGTGVAGAKGAHGYTIGTLTGFLFTQATPAEVAPSVQGAQEPQVLTLGGFLFCQATPVESVAPEPSGGSGGSVSKRRLEDDEIITLFGMLIQSGILDE